jgi:mono/diheme cytochrome c family protein
MPMSWMQTRRLLPGGCLPPQTPTWHGPGVWIFVVAMAGIVWTPSARSQSEAPVDYQRHIKPLLHEHCIDCHGPDAQQSGLRLDAYPLILQGGDRGPGLLPGKPQQSVLLHALRGTGGVQRMPEGLPALKAEQIALVERWIAQGARGPADEPFPPAARSGADHWAFQPVVRPKVPEVAQRDWVRNPIDCFILARLEAAGLQPAAEASRATLIRRLSLDLLGLPPSTDEVEAFVGDPRPDAYERLVDRLLASPHFGERWGRHWLDAARYADSNGYTIDGPRLIWKYRDWVIEALNRDLPFDQFTIEQLAGDMLPGATLQQIVATGFHRNTLINQEGGTDQEQFRVEAVVDRIDTTGMVFLGLTLGCARCHEHKYDPVSQREFYQLFALFNGADEPSIRVPSPQQEEQLRQARAAVAEAERRLRQFDAAALQRRRDWEQCLAQAVAQFKWTALQPSDYASSGGATLTVLDDRSLLVAGKVPDSDTYTVTMEIPLRGVTAVLLEALTHDTLPRGGPGLAANGNFVLTDVQIGRRTLAEPDTLHPVRIVRAVADHEQDRFPIAHAIDDDPQQTGWAINVTSGSLNVARQAVFVLERPLADDDTRLTVTLRHGHRNRYNLGRFRISVTAAAPEVVTLPEDVRAALAVPEAQRSAEQQQLLAVELLRDEPQRVPLQEAVNRAQQALADLEKQIPTTLVLRERATPRPTHIHIRGDFLRLGAAVEPGVPAVLPPLRPAGDRPTRLDFARWLVQADHPLTPRVTVNRVWQHYFGRGIVETENDFGTQGAAPTHPELLDYLASELVRQGWSLKALHRLIVTSAAYRQSSQVTPEALAADPNNRLWGRQSRLRLEAEIIRDQALAASGLLARGVGGPSVFPPQPSGIYSFTQNKKNWVPSTGADRYRRGMYTYFWRSSPDPFLMVFDAPNANVTCTRRVRSNTPLQALTLANDTAFVEMAQALAGRLLREAPQETPEQRVALGFRLCLAREPQPQEQATLVAMFHRAAAHYAADPQAAQAAAGPLAGTVDSRTASGAAPHNPDVATAAAWVAVARVLLNLDEFVTRE